MIAKKPIPKKAKPTVMQTKGVPVNWRESLVKRLTKVREIDGIFVVLEGNTIHVFTVVEGHESKVYKPLIKQENLVEQDHPALSFDFHTREHQGRPPHRAVPYGAEKVFLR